MKISSDSFLNQPPSVDGGSSMRKKGARLQMAFAQNESQAKPQMPVAKQSQKASSQQRAQKQKVNTSYRDWQVREETVRKARLSGKGSSVQSGASTQKMSATQPGMGQHQRRSSKNSTISMKKSKSRSKSRPRSISHETADEIKRRVQLQFNNYMGQKDEDDEISLLEDSQASAPRNEKKQFVKESKIKRKKDTMSKKEAELAELMRKEENLKALELRNKSQIEAFKKELEANKIRDKHRGGSNRLKPPRPQDNNSNLSDPYSTQQYGTHGPKKVKTGKQASELRQWIDNAMKDENLQNWETPSLATDPSAQNLEIPGVELGKMKPKKKAKSRSKSKSVDKNTVAPTSAKAADKSKKAPMVNISAISNKSFEEFASRQSGKTKMLKHQLPGNSSMTEGEARKYGARPDRYGIFGQDGTSEFDRVVSNQRSKLLEIVGSKENSVTEPDQRLSKDDASKVKEKLTAALKSLGSRSDVKVQDSQIKQSQIDSEDDISEIEDIEQSGRQSPDSEDSSDKIPVKQSAAQRQHRFMINQAVDEKELEEPMPKHLVPGIVNTQAHFERLEQQKHVQRRDAALVIQKHFRGHRGRKYFKRKQVMDRERVEIEYEKLNRELKADNQYNLKSYLADKKRIREKTGLVDSVSADEIAEVIGESGSIGSGRIRQSGHVSTQLQNFFKPDASKSAASGKDPLSLIAIFAKRNGVIPEQTKERRLGKQEKSSSRDRRGRIHGRQTKKAKTISTDSPIEEEYPDDFSDSIQQDESIIEEDMPKTSSGSHSTKLRGQQQQALKRGSSSASNKVQTSARLRRAGGKPAKDESDSIKTDVIEDEVTEEDADLKEDSIKEDSIANEIESDEGGIASKKRSSESIAEDSIIKEEYDGDNFAPYNASQSLQARNKIRFGMSSATAAVQESEPKKLTETEKRQEDELVKLADDQAHKTLEKNRMIGNFMDEMKEYEKSVMSEALVNRLEKIVTSSLAQKDQIIMAQRLAELEAEKRHKEEINKIREEQIKLMSQLMLLGPAAGAGVPGVPVNAELSQKYREDLLHSIQKIIEKPIEIKHETVHVNYSVSKAPEDQSAIADRLGMSTSQAKKSYLEEYEESQRISKRGPVVTHPRSTYQDMIEEDISLRLGKSGLDISQSKGKQIRDESIIEDMVGDVHSAIEESIRDEIGESRLNASKMSKHSRDNSDMRMRDRQQDQQKVQQNQIFHEIERQIDVERSEREEQLATDLKKRKISERTYDQEIQKIEKWVVKEKKELMQRRRKADENSKDLLKYVDKFKKDRHSVPTINNIAASPRPDSALLSYQDDSQTSDQIQNAMRQAYMLEKDLTGMSPEQKYMHKKRLAASNLLEQKEKAIQKALAEKINQFQGNQAEDMMQRAIELDVDAEVMRRFEKVKRDIDESKSLDTGRLSESYEQNRTTTGRNSKRVHFRESGKSTKPTNVSTERNTTSSKPKLEDDDISESIQIAESIADTLMSQSVPDVSAKRDKSGSKQQQHSISQLSQQEQQDKFSPQGRDMKKEASDRQKAEGSDSESSIEEQYSYNESFDQSSKTNEISQSVKNSKNKLQLKASQIEDSAAYSESFEEESMGQSSKMPHESAEKDQVKQMATVKEESVDDSQEGVSSEAKDALAQSGTSKSSKGAPKIESSIASLPSEDASVQDSVRSVDWKYDIQLESAREVESEQSSEKKKNSFIREEKLSETEEIEDEQDSSSDLNTRDDIADLESCPDMVGNSASMSGPEADLGAQADLITDELMHLLIDNYKNEDDFDLNAANEQPDEEEFKDKFPWTMDKKPEPKPAPKPAGVKVGVAPKPPKTLREIKDDAFKQKHEEALQKLKDRENRVISFLDFMCKRVDLKELIEALNKPIQRDPMKILSQMVNCYDEEDSLERMDDAMLLQSQILPQSFFNKTDREYVIMDRMKMNRAAVEDSDQLTVSQEEMENINNVHHYALFESMNEALDHFRPYTNKGEPMPWSKNTRQVKKIETEAQAKQVLEKACEQVIKWMRTRAGTSYAPLPDPPAQTQDEMGEEIIPPPLEEGEEDRRNMNRQEKLAELMTDDIIEHDALWVDYEIQDTQTRFDLADMILHHLAGEIAEFLAEKNLEQ